MAFCSKCGKPIDDDAAFCPECGKPVGVGTPLTGDGSFENPYKGNNKNSPPLAQGSGLHEGSSYKDETDSEQVIGQKKLEKTTRRVMATIEQVIIFQEAGGLDRVKLLVKYPTEQGWFVSELITGTSNTNKFKQGQSIKVVYESDNPGVPEEEAGVFFMLFFVVLLVIIVVVVGLSLNGL